jgi:hypothetical protein
MKQFQYAYTVPCFGVLYLDIAISLRETATNFKATLGNVEILTVVTHMEKWHNTLWQTGFTEILVCHRGMTLFIILKDCNF